MIVGRCTIVGLEVLFLCGVVFIVIFFKVWWGVLFGVADSGVVKVEDGSYDLIESLLVFLLLIQLILGIQPALLVNGFGFF